MTFYLWSTLALLVGYLLDRLIGDPPRMPHIIRLIGQWIEFVERRLRSIHEKTPGAERRAGIWLVIIVSSVCFALPVGLLYAAYRLYLPFGFLLETFFVFQLLAVKSLAVESKKVKTSLVHVNLEKARQDLAMIVGRDTAALNRDEIIRATVETVAENTADGVIAPLFYAMLGGAPLACLYKAVNTMDSMVAYKNEKYLHFGRMAARLDDVLNYLPSRLAALLMIVAAGLLGHDPERATKIWRRDRRQHPSPNSAQTEAVAAGALGIQLAGPATYFGTTIDKPYIGDKLREVKSSDIDASIKLMKLTSVLMLTLAIGYRVAWMVIIYG